jgi:hypothetical protein
MAANTMSNALKHPHPDVPFATVGDDTLTALAQLADIFQKQIPKPRAPELTQAPIKAATNKQPSALLQPLLTSPMKHTYQKRSQGSPHANLAGNTPSPPRVISPMTREAASPRVSA